MDTMDKRGRSPPNDTGPDPEEFISIDDMTPEDRRELREHMKRTGGKFPEIEEALKP